MKINEIITESRSQLDEGMMDTLKGKLSGIYQKLNKMPGFSKVVQQVKTHSGELNKIAQALQAKSRSEQLTKQDVLAAVMPLANTVSSEMGGGGVDKSALSRGDPMLDSLANMLISSLGGPKQAVQESKVVLKEGIGDLIVLLGFFIAAYLAWMTMVSGAGTEAEQERRKKLSPEQRKREDFQRQQENLQYEYDSLERKYKEDRRNMSYAETRRMEELYNELRKPPRNEVPRQLQSPNDDQRFIELKNKLKTGTSTKREREEYEDLYIKGYR